jgi:hypothetical protein
MTMYTKVVGTLETVHPDLETVREWAKRTFTKERIAGLVVCVSTVTILGMVLHILHRALETRSIVGF